MVKRLQWNRREVMLEMNKASFRKLVHGIFPFDWLESIERVIISALLMAKGFWGRLARQTKSVSDLEIGTICQVKRNQNCSSTLLLHLFHTNLQLDHEESFFSLYYWKHWLDSHTKVLSFSFVKICFTWLVGWQVRGVGSLECCALLCLDTVGDQATTTTRANIV